MKSKMFVVAALLSFKLVLAQSLPSPVAAALANAGLSAEHISIAVIPVREEKNRLLHNSNSPFQPASTMKLITSVAALDLLGPNYRGKTELLIDGPIRGGVAQGSVTLRGVADPDLDVPALWSMLYKLKAQGVHEIRGNVILDRNFFVPSRFDLGLSPFDESPESQYNVIPDALYLNQGILRYSFESDQHKLRVRTEPPLFGVTVRSRMSLSDGVCKDWDDEWKPADVVVSRHTRRVTISLNGTFPRNCTTDAELQLFERDLLANRLVRQLWADMGGRLRGRVVEGIAPVTARVIAQHESRPLGEVLRHMNKASDNPLTRLMFLSMGANAPVEFRNRYPTTREASEARVKEWFAKHDIATDGLVLDNGSGLSRSERVTSMQMASMLRVAWQKNYAPELMASMPLAGVDGTMRNRLKQSVAAGRARIKTGTLRNTTAVAGYVADADQNMWVISAMINHEKAAAARPALDALIDWVATQRTHEVVPVVSAAGAVP